MKESSKKIDYLRSSMVQSHSMSIDSQEYLPTARPLYDKNESHSVQEMFNIESQRDLEPRLPNGDAPLLTKLRTQRMLKELGHGVRLRTSTVKMQIELDEFTGPNVDLKQQRTYFSRRDRNYDDNDSSEEDEDRLGDSASRYLSSSLKNLAAGFQDMFDDALHSTTKQKRRNYLGEELLPNRRFDSYKTWFDSLLKT